MDRKIILSGCGIVGHEILEKLGKNNILCFCDNDMSLHGTSRWGKEIFSFIKIYVSFQKMQAL